MRLTISPLLIAGVSLVAFAQASPMRVVVVSGQNDVSSFTRTHVSGNPAPAFLFEAYAHGPMIAVPNGQGQGRGHHLCQKFKNKALEISNKFRETFGLPLIEKSPENLIVPPPLPIPFPDRPAPPNGHGRVKNMPIEGGLSVPIPIFMPEDHEVNRDPSLPVDDAKRVECNPAMPHYRHGQCRRSFVHRLHRALMVLGPWEGRAVAFVLGCGIGVLLRMFWVMAVVITRSFRGRSNDDDDDVEHILVFERDAEDIFVPPPEYTDEKVALVVEDKKADATA